MLIVLFCFFFSGFKLSNKTFSTLVMRFANRKGEIEFGDFILCAIKLKTMLGKRTFLVYEYMSVFNT